MPSAASRRRSRSVYEDDESSAPESAKRPRNARGGHRKSSSPEGGSEEDTDDVPMPVRRENDPSSSHANGLPDHSDLDSYQPGAIVRVTLNNFVTYEHAEFLPGPNLNMVIGPNGTGKSSLVCAICLGLGFHPKHLGRATQVGEFVKNGKETAVIEVELQRQPKERANPVIRVQIMREDNSRKWWLNGKETTHKNIQAVTRIMRIQIDNLCQFLPQDKVAEFAGLTPVQLLHETLRAAAPEEMIKWQTTLKDLHQDYKKIKELVESSTETLSGLEARQQGLQADVDRLGQREAIKEKINDLRNARICAAYQDARDRYKKANEQKKDAEKRYKELEQACGPALEAVTRKQDYRTKVAAAVEDKKKARTAAEMAVMHAQQDIKTHDESLQDIKSKWKGEDSSFRSRREEISKIRRNITSLEARYKQEPPAFVASDWTQKIREKEHVLRDMLEEKRQADTEKSEIMRQGRAVMQDIKDLEIKMKSLDSQEGQQLSLLKRIDQDVAAGWDWLRDHAGEFEKEVFGPAMLLCSLKDSRYSNQVQAMLQRSDFLCFTTQTRNDHKKLSDRFYKDMGLSVTIRTCGSQIHDFRPPVSTAEARKLGLDGFAIDFIEGPEPVLAMLCAEKQLHGSGVALRDITSEQYDQLYSGQHRISQWATGQTHFKIIRRREYGPNAITTNTRKIQPGKFWTDQPVDNAEKVEVQNQIAEKTEQRKAFENELQVVRSRLEGVKSKEEEVQEELETLRSEKNKLQTAHTHWVALPEKIATEKDNLKAKMEGLGECRARKAALEVQTDETNVEKAQAVLRHHKLVEKLRGAHLALLEGQIWLVEATSDVRGLKDRNTDIMTKLGEKRQEILNYGEEAAHHKRDATRARDDVTKLAASSDSKGIDYYSAKAEGKTLEDIDNEINAEISARDLIQGVDPGILDQYEKRKRDIEGYSQKKEEFTRKLDKISQQIQKLMESWEPKADELVSRINDAFSYNFEQINCAGEVGIHKDEDFEQWAIEIKVKFRENETLQQLNQHRQSGGERAVSTIFYLMALQSMAQAPFRVVDEINQGMDPRNERMVHERMVEIACREHTSQYFLITPKLLTGLRYDERMRVLCIASGEHVPDDAKKLNFRKLATKMRLAVKGAA